MMKGKSSVKTYFVDITLALLSVKLMIATNMHKTNTKMVKHLFLKPNSSLTESILCFNYLT